MSTFAPKAGHGGLKEKKYTFQGEGLDLFILE